jgi:predicted kinase
VWVDPDQIRHCLPEFEVLVRHEAGQAGERTRKEAGMLSEVLIQAALKAGKSVIVDGSLRDRQWYQDYFHHLRHDYPGIRIAILHVTAPRTAVLERAAVSLWHSMLATISPRCSSHFPFRIRLYIPLTRDPVCLTLVSLFH